MTKKKKPSASIAKKRMKYIREIDKIDNILEDAQQTVKEKEQRKIAQQEAPKREVKQLFADCEVSTRTIIKLRELFSDVGTEIGDEQLILIISNFKSCFNSCETIDEIIQRIRVLSKSAYFK